MVPGQMAGRTAPPLDGCPRRQRRPGRARLLQEPQGVQGGQQLGHGPGIVEGPSRVLLQPPQPVPDGVRVHVDPLAGLGRRASRRRTTPAGCPAGWNAPGRAGRAPVRAPCAPAPRPRPGRRRRARRAASPRTGRPPGRRRAGWPAPGGRNGRAWGVAEGGVGRADPAAGPHPAPQQLEQDGERVGVPQGHHAQSGCRGAAARPSRSPARPGTPRRPVALPGRARRLDGHHDETLLPGQP